MPVDTQAQGQQQQQTPVPGIAELIRQAEEHPAQPVIEGMLHETEMAGLHGPPEVFKTFLVMQLAEAIATGRPFLGIWRVPHPKTVFFFETEMSVAALGKRLKVMFRDRAIPGGVHFATESRLRQFKRAGDVAAKFVLLNGWVRESGADVVIIDTCNPFFRGKQSPNDETTAGGFFDLLEALPASTKLFVRHNRKPRQDDYGEDGASRIRGSGQFADVPDLLMEIRRPDKRTNQAVLAVTKFRHGTKPADLALWFDAGDLRLTSLPPVICLLQGGPLSRTDLLTGLSQRFGIEQRTGDSIIAAQGQLLQNYQQGRNRVFEIDRQAASGEFWFPRISEGS